MRNYMVAAALLVGVGAAGVVMAQPKALTRSKDKDSKEERKEEKKDEKENQGKPPPHAASDNVRMCEARRNVMTNEERRLETLQAEAAGYAAEIAALTKRLDDLKKQSDDAKRTLAGSEKRVSRAKDIYKRDCSKDESCGIYETQATGLDQRSEQVQRDLDSVRGDIGGSRKNIQGLESKIAPLQKEYADKKCNNLVPGETEQSTIDRCTAIFSEWNRLQADLNRENSRVPELRSKYEALFAELKALEKRAADYGDYLGKNCSSSPQTAKMKNVVGVRERAQTLSTELDSLVADIAKLRGVKITVTAQ